MHRPTCPTRDLFLIQCRVAARPEGAPPCLREAERVEREASALAWRAVKTVAAGSRLAAHMPDVQPLRLLPPAELAARLAE